MLLNAGDPEEIWLCACSEDEEVALVLIATGRISCARREVDGLDLGHDNVDIFVFR